jgi:hypothetical protein
VPHHPYMGSAAAEEDCTILRGHNGPFMTSVLLGAADAVPAAFQRSRSAARGETGGLVARDPRCPDISQVYFETDFEQQDNMRLRNHDTATVKPHQRHRAVLQV